jgi:hypothetical protein
MMSFRGDGAMSGLAVIGENGELQVCSPAIFVIEAPRDLCVTKYVLGDACCQGIATSANSSFLVNPM